MRSWRPCWLLTAAVAALSVWAGCSTIVPEPTPQGPRWVEWAEGPPPVGRFVAAVGQATQPGDAADDEADADARRAIRAALDAYTLDALHAFLESDGRHPDPDAPLSREWSDAMVGQVSAGILRSARRHDTWEAPDGGTYVLYRQPTTDVDAAIEAALPEALELADPFGASADQLPGRLHDVLEARATDRMADVHVVAVETTVRPDRTQMPEWPRLGRHDDYPTEEFFTAVGLGPRLPAAESAAREQLAARLDTALKRLFAQVRAEGNTDALAQNTRWLSPLGVRFSGDDLQAARIAERWHDPVTETHYALAALDRATAGMALLRALDGSRPAAADLLASALNQHRAGNHGASLQDYVEAIVSARRTLQLQMEAIVLSPEGLTAELATALEQPLLAEAKEGLQSLLAELVLERAGGDQQWMAPGATPAEPFVVRVVGGEEQEPVGGVPLRLDAGGRTLAAPGFTDQVGVAQWVVDRALPETGDSLQASIGLDALHPDMDTYRLTMPQVTFTYVLRSRANSELVLYIRETTKGGPSPLSPVTTALRRALQDGGFSLMDHSEVLQHATGGLPPPDADDAELLRAFAGLQASVGPGRFVLVAAGEVSTDTTEPVETDGGLLYIVHCTFRVRVLDAAAPATDKAVVTVEGVGKGAYVGSEAEAASRAQAEAATDASAKLMAGLSARLGAPVQTP